MSEMKLQPDIPSAVIEMNVQPDIPRAEIEIEVSGPGRPGKDGAPGYTPQRGVDYWTEADRREIRNYVEDQIANAGGVHFTTDETLIMSEDGVLSVNTATEVDPDNTRPITSAAVHTTVGNIEILLSTI